VVIGHAAPPSWVGDDHPMAHFRFPTTDEVLADLASVTEGWLLVWAEVVDKPTTDPVGRPGTRADNVVHLARQGS